MSFLSRIKASEFLKNVFTLVSATTVAQGIALLIYPILTDIYSPSEHGLFALYMSIISVTAMISTGKYELAILLPKNEKDAINLSFLSIGLSFFFSLFLLIFIFVFKNHIGGWLGNEHLTAWLFFIPLSTFFIAVFQSLTYWFNRNKKYKSIAGANFSQSLTNSAVKLSTSRAISQGGGLITGAIAGQFIGAVIFLNRFAKKSGAHLKELSFSKIKILAKKYSFFPRYNMLHYVTNNFSSSLPIFVFSSYFSSEQVGFYSLGFMMINRPMNLLTGSFTQVFSQRSIEAHNMGKKIAPDVRKFVFRLFLIAILPFSIAAVFGPQIFKVVFGEEWETAGQFMRILLPWLFVVFLSSPLSFLPDMLSRQRKAMWIDIIKFLFRIMALGIGVITKDIYLSLVLFSGISLILVSYSLYWYVNLSQEADHLLIEKSSTKIEK